MYDQQQQQQLQPLQDGPAMTKATPDARVFLVIVTVLAAGLLLCGLPAKSGGDASGSRLHQLFSTGTASQHTISSSYPAVTAALSGWSSPGGANSSSSSGALSTGCSTPARTGWSEPDASNAGSSSSSDGSGACGSNGSSAQHELVVPDIRSREENVLPDVAAQVMALERQGKGRKIISISLYGNDTRYTSGAIENALLVQRGWPGWTLRLYYGGGVPPEVLATVRLLGAETVPASSFPSASGALYTRFFILDDRTVTRYIIRDADARLTPRDFYAVQEWASTKRPFHILRDDVYHGLSIMGGMWGAVGGLLHPRILEPFHKTSNMAAADAKKWNKYGGDQVWLGQTVHPLVKNLTLLHASWHCKKYSEAEWRGFPTQRIHNRDFVGNVYWGMNNFQGRTISGPDGGACPVECRRRKDWTLC